MTYRIAWDNGASASGVFPQKFETEEEAQAEADDIEAQNIAGGIWDEDGYCEVFEETDPPNADHEHEMEDLRRAALNRGRP